MDRETEGAPVGGPDVAQREELTDPLQVIDGLLLRFGRCWVPDDCIESKIGSLLRAGEVMALLVSTSALEEAQ
ncbi:MAG: hypothetical protein [Olavius algarvensis Gamma 1 endosymbiont]|nr:MAG: hypothetical protein [Olavius algarvensis Gamma 1 endosymbiont]